MIKSSVANLNYMLYLQLIIFIFRSVFPPFLLGGAQISQKLLLWGMTILALIVAGGHILEEAFARGTSDFFSTFLFL